MSNRSLLDRLEAALANFRDGDMPISEFLQLFRLSTHSFENTTPETIQTLRRHAQAIEREADYHEQGFAADTEAACAALSASLQSLKAQLDRHS